MDTLTVCSVPLKRGSRRQKSFFVLIGFPLCSISTEHHRMQKGLYHPVSVGLEVILLFLGLKVETCRECLAQLLAIFSATGMQAVTICQWTGAYLKNVYFLLCQFVQSKLQEETTKCRNRRDLSNIFLSFFDLIFYFYLCAFSILFYETTVPKNFTFQKC